MYGRKMLPKMCGWKDAGTGCSCTPGKYQELCPNGVGVRGFLQRSVDVLMVTDHFTKLAHAFSCPNQTAKKVAKKLWDNVF